jgi:hypothetical protein
MEWPKLDLNVPFRLLLTFNATSLLVIVFLVQKGYVLGSFFLSMALLLRFPISCRTASISASPCCSQA